MAGRFAHPGADSWLSEASSVLEDEISLLQTGPEQLPPGAERLAEEAARGELQAALSLARLAAECPSLPLRRGLCRKIREISHPESARVALFYLLSQLARQPELSMPLVLELLEGPAWVASTPDPVPNVPGPGQPKAPSDSAQPTDPSSPPDLDIKSLRALFVHSSVSERRLILRRCLASGSIDLACQLPLDGDDWDEIWPHLSLEHKEQFLLSLPVRLACRALGLLQDRPEWQILARAVPEDLAFLGWATPAPSQTLTTGGGTLREKRAKYPSDAPYYDGVDGVLESQGWTVRVDGQALKVFHPDGRCLWTVLLEDFATEGYADLARHDRFFDDLNPGQANRLSSLALCVQSLKLAVGTCGGGVKIYDLEQGRILHELYPDGPALQEALPVRLRFSQEGNWLAGVRLGHFFVWSQAGERTLDSLPGEVRGLFFRGSQLWAVVREGSVFRLDPARGVVVQELKPGLILPALSPDRRWLASYEAEQIRVYGLSEEGLLPLGQLSWNQTSTLNLMSTPRPVRVEFIESGEALVLRLLDPQKSGSRSTFIDLGWRAGHLCLSQFTEWELAHYLSQSRVRPHPVWDFLVALAEARMAASPVASSGEQSPD